jgi:hypothetical protein
VSSGPTKYRTVTLPDADIISELTPRGQVFRTDRNDVACRSNPSKVGPDNDGEPDGCDNVRIVIPPTDPMSCDKDYSGFTSLAFLSSRNAMNFECRR